jgi:hypothetical protein
MMRKKMVAKGKNQERKSQRRRNQREEGMIN